MPGFGSERSDGDTAIEAIGNEDSALTGQEMTSPPQPGFLPQTLHVLLGGYNMCISESKAKT